MWTVTQFLFFLERMIFAVSVDTKFVSEKAHFYL